MTAPANCPIAADLRRNTREIQTLSASMIRALRRLRSDLLFCETCAENAGCEFRNSIGAQIRQAVDEIGAELETALLQNSEPDRR